MYIYIYMCICIHIHMYMYMYVYIYIYTSTYMSFMLIRIMIVIIGSPLCPRPLGPEEWMLKCLDVWILVFCSPGFRFGTNLSCLLQACGHFWCLRPGFGAVWALLGQPGLPNCQFGRSIDLRTRGGGWLGLYSLKSPVVPSGGLWPGSVAPEKE